MDLVGRQGIRRMRFRQDCPAALVVSAAEFRQRPAPRRAIDQLRADDAPESGHASQSVVSKFLVYSDGQNAQLIS
ncbi:hypothetical protein [Noviherbaspirillum aerium]|uniref:hypothetical protein n=1 Tax=Noviherbaspirillum aerium TaxID=2588497 RepID=UPI00178C6C50|nr:hypothetical protein [Noviherbaspirillum aerium]